MDQFSSADAAAGHADMLRRIRAQQILNEPEPDHEPTWFEEQELCDPAPRKVWCCDWHKWHADA